MPSKSKAQQRFFGMVDAYKKGEMKNASSKIKKAANGMSMSDVKDFAKTKHKGLPEKVEEQTIVRLTESDLRNIVKESVNKILNEMSPEVYMNYQKGRLNQANQARANGDYDTEMKMRSKAAVGGNAWGNAMRQKHGFDSIDDFNQTAQKSRYGITNQSGNPKHQNYINYQNDVAKQFS